MCFIPMKVILLEIPTLKETRKGEKPSSCVLDMVHMIYIKMKIEEISADKTYIIVNLEAKNFILTLRLAYYRYKNHKDLLGISKA